MKCVIEDTSRSYSQGILAFSATVKIVTDDYDGQGAGSVMHQDGISTRTNVAWEHDWYTAAKAELLQQAIYVRDKYIEVMTVVAQKTGQLTEDAMIADVVGYLESSLNGGV